MCCLSLVPFPHHSTEAHTLITATYTYQLSAIIQCCALLCATVGMGMDLGRTRMSLCIGTSRVINDG